MANESSFIFSISELQKIANAPPQKRPDFGNIPSGGRTPLKDGPLGTYLSDLNLRVIYPGRSTENLIIRPHYYCTATKCLGFQGDKLTV